jgi:hypothetical protein
MSQQTIANNAFLRAAKRLYNAPIYANVARLMNDEGESACKAYLASIGMPTDPESFGTPNARPKTP